VLKDAAEELARVERLLESAEGAWHELRVHFGEPAISNAADKLNFTKDVQVGRREPFVVCTLEREP
jgi:hypothetical protein